MNPDYFFPDVGDRPFLPPYRDKTAQDKCHRKRRPRLVFPVDVKKHPVSLLYEYCNTQHVKPSFAFYEIPQSVGIEYGCIVSVENFSGEGQSFSKKTAKQRAAANFLWKLTQQDYFGDPDNSTKRFVSETGIISVHYEEDLDSCNYKRRSCFKSSNSIGRGIKKKVQWQDTSDGECEIDEEAAAAQADLPPSDSENEVSVGCEEEILTREENSSKRSTSILRKDNIKQEMEVEERDGERPPAVLGEIEDYLSQRLLKANIAESNNGNDDDSSEDEVIEVKIEDEPKRKKTKLSHPDPDAALVLKRKVCLKDINPIGYLQEACQCFKIPLPTYIQIKEHGSYRIICILEDHKEQGSGINPKEAKRVAASRMIEYRGW